MPNEKITHYSIFRKALELEREGRTIYHLEVGDPDVSIDPEIIDEMCSKAKMGFTHYSDSHGIIEFREAITTYIKDRIGVSREKENILVTIGSKTGLYLTLRYVLKPGNVIATLEPIWGVYRSLAREIGLQYISFKTKLEDDWMPTEEILNQIEKTNFDAFILLNPVNPTGRVWPKPLVDRLLDIIERKNAYLIGDEVYFETIHEESKNFPSSLRYDYKKTITLYSMSKSHAMTGFRLGWVVAEKNIIEILSNIVQYMYTNVPVFIQYAGVKALSKKEILSRTREAYKERVKIVANTLSKLGFKFYYPEATFYLFAKLPEKIINVEKFILGLLEHSSIAVAPGNSFGDYYRFIRLSSSSNEKTLNKAMYSLEQYFKNYYNI